MVSITRLFDFPYYQQETYNLPVALANKKNGVWEKTSTEEYIAKANAVSRALLRMGVQKDDKIALISSNNRTEWNIMDIGILQTGAQNVPIYPTIAEEDYEYILNHSGSIYCFVSDDEVLQKVNAIKANVPTLKEVYSFNEIPGCKHWSDLLLAGEDESNQSEVEARKDSIHTDDLATIIYTSGTTGRPKGVMLSHKNIVSNVLDSAPRIPFDPGKSTALSFLPICHIFERMILYIYQYYGVSVYFGESIDKISDNLKEVRPTVITAVPRLLEKVYDKIYAKGTELTGIKKKLFFWAIDLGLKYEPYGANGFWYEFQLKIARKLIFSKWKEGLGGKLDLMVSGSAALQPRLSRVFAAAEIPVMEGYGLTETSPVIAVNDQRNRGFKIGTVGKPIRNVEVKIAEDGEILLKGPNVMLGYYKDPEKTAEAVIDGYFHTGDIGEIDSEGFLKITDRKKEMFKTSGGKYIAPQMIENAMKQSRFIEQIMVIGEGEKMPGAFIQPNFEFVKEWAKIHKITLGSSDAEISSNPDVIKRIDEEVESINKKFGHWEQVKRFELTPDVWSIDGGQLTPTLKLKRKIIKEIYKDLYAKIYDHN
ncbi:AMP-dependent synthetase/ligase [Flavobacterium johnsoniae]|uniref:AMP-dependent synthetase and ligase n=1 Tax=Flavobacterium johnsoniae (strain ATCC 17061 / DSM 2064 / JCM 8514 / BCRC 14874 / CCUG 350202 / NBRC 14942 / NCIMB 11054 / UW101) TaxID=376686 RepID=A5FAN8_FLAJ1|nr:AMP-dependent synthetase/ligase [Flavobacterium johnsoniae]ABQ07727.1 AMP-dependent synthetase and ligase [Flavobacterium johnsoniae UW101]OXG01812.1 long-chain fatty acid--CoA ligase [Flavobacterium johnsoniae UW101]WQG80434.1 AMP-dependent synthetase/ligase [Flavobacterium johnsoniae UW101]SHL04058.1 long-chain acyl-CoA synthetase [Flavobacterium johnsoniae]